MLCCCQIPIPGGETGLALLPPGEKIKVMLSSAAIDMPKRERERIKKASNKI